MDLGLEQCDVVGIGTGEELDYGLGGIVLNRNAQIYMLCLLVST
jgi:hypothetical protein